MEISRNKFFATLLIVALASMVAAYPIKNYIGHRDPLATANVFVFAETASGSETLYSGNQIMDIGDWYVAMEIGTIGSGNTTSHNATQWISLSNNALPAVSATQLATEINANGFSRALGTVSALWLNSGNYAFNVTKTFTATGTQQLQTAGLQWTGVPVSDSNLFASAAFTQTTFGTGDNLTISWIITFTR